MPTIDDKDHRQDDKKRNAFKGKTKQNLPAKRQDLLTDLKDSHFSSIVEVYPEEHFK